MRITPLLLANLAGVPSSTAQYRVGAPVEPLHVPLYSYLVETSGAGLLLFDLGCCSAERAAAVGRPGVSDRRTPAQAVADAGFDPAAVATIVVSHLHWDHCEGMDEFANARILVQREELRFAFAPDPEQWQPYDSWELGRRAHWIEHTDRMEPIDGYRRLGPGLRVVPTPGHTPGSQSLLVESDQTFLLCGDLFMAYENWLGIEGPTGTRTSRIPPGIHSDLRSWRNAVDMIEHHGWIPLPAHDPRILDVLAGRWLPGSSPVPS